MGGYKTTLFYEIQTKELLENLDTLSKEQIREKLLYMLSDFR